MRGNVNTLSDVFRQLGLPADPASIADFIARHQGVWPDAPVWTASQKSFLEEAIAQDADWSLPAETLSSLLRP